jgi:putative ABC transport system ATP-binding protein
VNGVTATARPGARIAIVGPSGSGKSSLIHLIAGLDEPTAGTVRWLGLSTPPQDDPAVVGVVFQGPSLIPALTAHENVALPLVLRGAPHEEAQDMALAHLDSLGLAQMAHQLPEELSGGQAQRVAVARVLATRPSLILADEPTGQLDQRSGQQVVDLLCSTATQVGAGLVIATHDQHVADRMDTVWWMRDGSLRSAREQGAEAAP